MFSNLLTSYRLGCMKLAEWRGCDCLVIETFSLEIDDRKSICEVPCTNFILDDIYGHWLSDLIFLYFMGNLAVDSDSFGL